MWLDSFLLRAGLAGVGIALAAGPLGCFVIWRRMAFFSDATAHASVLGVGLALAFDAPIFGGALVAAFLMALTVSTLTNRGATTDATLAVLSHAALGLGLLTVSLLPGVQIDLFGYLFGDILAVRRIDLLLVWLGSALILALLIWRWSGLLISTLGSDLAVSSGIDSRRETMVLTVALAVFVACGIKVLGALLIGALLVIPASTARVFTRTPESMAVLSSAIGAGSAVLGVTLSWQVDTPAGPSIVAVMAGAFLAAQLWRGMVNLQRA